MNEEILNMRGFVEHSLKEGLFLKKLDDGTMLFADYRKDKPYFYGTSDGEFLDNDELEARDVKSDFKYLMQLWIGQQKEQTKLV